VAAALPISGLTAWQGLFDHAHLKTGQTVLIHGAAGAVRSIALQLARELGARVIGTGRAGDRETALGLGADAFVDLQAGRLEDAGEVDVALDVIGGKVLERSAPLVRAGGTLVRIVGPPTVRPADGRAIFFVVEPDRFRLADLAERVRSGRLNPIVGAVRPLAEAPSAFAPDRRVSGKTIIRSRQADNRRRRADQQAGRSGRPARSRPIRPCGDQGRHVSHDRPAAHGLERPRLPQSPQRSCAHLSGRARIGHGAV
jgi:NADPH:quinone reductase-like Zn-dependent oxidoreductase